MDLDQPVTTQAILYASNVVGEDILLDDQVIIPLVTYLPSEPCSCALLRCYESAQVNPPGARRTHTK